MTSIESNSAITVVSDAGPLIALAKVHALNLLFALYQKVYTTESVYHETVTEGLAQGASDALLSKESYEQGTP